MHQTHEYPVGYFKLLLRVIRIHIVHIPRGRTVSVNGDEGQVRSAWVVQGVHDLVSEGTG